MELSSPKFKKLLYFLKNVFLIFQEAEFSRPKFKRLLIFQEGTFQAQKIKKKNPL